jgi:hypothetical protein
VSREFTADVGFGRFTLLNAVFSYGEAGRFDKKSKHAKFI